MVSEATKSFLVHAINGLTQENFNEMIKIFQKYYFKHEVVNVDGTNDGGCDIKVFINKREQKKCIQITIQKAYEKKLKADLEKVSEMISNYGYINKFEFFCSGIISEVKIEELRKFAIETYDIELVIFEANRLSQLDCEEVRNYIYSLHEDVIVKPKELNIEKSKKILYDLLAIGKDSTDIKNSFVESVIISILYEKTVMSMQELQDELEKRIEKNIPDLMVLVNNLKTDHRVEQTEGRMLQLSKIECEVFQGVLAASGMMEKDFKNELSKILKKYDINDETYIFEQLVILYKQNYSSDIDENNENVDSSNANVFEKLKKCLASKAIEKDCVENIIDEIRVLCLNNSYLNKISAGESFLNLYKSNRLEQYLNQTHKDIYLDTPAFIYILCSTYDVEGKDWDNPFYCSMKSLYSFYDKNPDKLQFYITQDYIHEVAGEIQKALQIAKFEKCSFFKELGETSNTVFSYYSYLKLNKLFFDDDGIESFEDFLYIIGFDHLDVNSSYFFKTTVNNIYVIAENLGIATESRKIYNNFYDVKTRYEKILLKKNKDKSETAIKNDTNLVLSVLAHESSSDCYLATWDTTICLLRDELINSEPAKKYNYFYISNPSKISNRIALENFNIKETALTNSIFAYAEKKYDISNRVRSLLELLAPIIKQSGKQKHKLLTKLSRIRKEQLENNSYSTDKISEDKSLPIEEVIITLIPNNDIIKSHENIMDKFSSFMSSDENADYIIGVINNMMNMPDYKKFDLSEFYKKIEDVYKDENSSE